MFSIHIRSDPLIYIFDNCYHWIKTQQFKFTLLYKYANILLTLISLLCEPMSLLPKLRNTTIFFHYQAPTINPTALSSSNCSATNLCFLQNPSLSSNPLSRSPLPPTTSPISVFFHSLLLHFHGLKHSATLSFLQC